MKVEFAEEARYFTEIRLLQQDVEIVLETVNNNNFVGSVHHPVCFNSLLVPILLFIVPINDCFLAI